MGKIKSKNIKKSAEELLKTDIEFSTDFDKTKKTLSAGMPSKKIRNQLAGYIVRLKKRQQQNS